MKLQESFRPPLKSRQAKDLSALQFPPHPLHLLQVDTPRLDMKISTVSHDTLNSHEQHLLISSTLTSLDSQSMDMNFPIQLSCLLFLSSERSIL